MNVINILKLRDEEIKAQEITAVKYAIYAVGKRPGEKKACVTQIFFFHLFFDSFIAVSLYFLANMRGSSALI